jgi:hypothetical protein
MLNFLECLGFKTKNPEAEREAVETALNWLNLVDSEQYAQSYSETSAYFLPCDRS